MIQKIIILVIVFSSINAIYGQNTFSGVINYTLTSNSDEFSKTEQALTLEQQAIMDSATKRASEKSNVRMSGSKTTTNKYILIFDKEEVSTFWYDDNEKTPFYYQNIINKIMLSKETTMSTIYLVADTIITIPWKISKISKKIQNIECFSAIAEYRGRVWTAWYAPSIPIPSGPWKLYGLPGMILEAEDRTGHVRFETTKIIIPQPVDIKENTKELLTSKKNKKISYKNYVEVLKESLENYDKMHTKVSNGGYYGGVSVNISNPEIFAFEEAMGKRFQQKLSDIPKK